MYFQILTRKYRLQIRFIYMLREARDNLRLLSFLDFEILMLKHCLRLQCAKNKIKYLEISQ